MLKSVLHIWALPSLMRMVPEAAIIHTHRDMREVLPSCCSVGAVLVSACAKDLDSGQVGPFALEVMREALARDTPGAANGLHPTCRRRGACRRTHFDR